MKKIICDKCGESIELKKGELFNLEISKIEENSIKDYPINPDRDYVLEMDLCKKCFNKIKKEIK